ncbi:MAG TPA: TetR family transcriptional regulator [Niabella sp.]|nr:TetR family transcriptional regulator [Chitinophagaceae bacterium]HRN46802.1 TetR family transcriptional regulator [Niabella sp.]HRO85258.1 TetR family transcriptional regulator [Niabella sp.]HUN03885.1 TetR family transcriptional regulator [Niabella sp.]
MGKAKNLEKEDLSTELKIKDAAAIVFQKKGFAATRTRDIAEEAGLNLALINYYYRSKKNLFDIIMAEKLSTFFRTFIPFILSEDQTPDEKIKRISKDYINLLLENPELPLFVLNAIHTNPEHFTKMIYGAEQIQHSPLVAQLKRLNPKAKFEQFFLNIMALCVFPFIMKPAISHLSDILSKDFENLMKERIEMIPKWMDAMIKVK